MTAAEAFGWTDRLSGDTKKMTTLVVGASGATGRLLVEQLLKRGQNVKVIIRSPDKLPDVLASQDNLTVIHASILNLSDAEMARYVNGCDAVASCLGHNLTFRGMFGQPRRLVTDATRRLCRAIKANTSEGPTKFVLMNTAGNSNRDLHEPISFGQKCVIGLLRLLLPPHVDNEQAADYLRTGIGQEYDAHSSPTRSAIFNPGSTSRINVGHFMAHLITDANTWERWKGRMPVVYNKSKGVVRGTAVNLRAIGERCAFATSCAR